MHARHFRSQQQVVLLFFFSFSFEWETFLFPSRFHVASRIRNCRTKIRVKTIFSNEDIFGRVQNRESPSNGKSKTTKFLEKRNEENKWRSVSSSLAPKGRRKMIAKLDELSFIGFDAIPDPLPPGKWWKKPNWWIKKNKMCSTQWSTKRPKQTA